MKSWYHDKFNDFQTLFAFNRILKRFSHTFVRGHGSWARCSKLPSISWICPHIGLNNVNIIFRLIILHYSKHLQFKFDLSKKTIQLNKMIIYSKRRNIPKLNMEYHGQYVDSRKKSEGRINFFLEHFVVCSTWRTQQTNKTRSKLFELACVLGTRQKKRPSPGSYWGGTFAVCHASGTRKYGSFAVCCLLPCAFPCGTRQIWRFCWWLVLPWAFCHVLLVCRVLFGRHSMKTSFVMCLRICSRQTSWHTDIWFPVVYVFPLNAEITI